MGRILPAVSKARQMAATCQLLAAAPGRVQAVSMTSTTNTSQPAAASGTFAIGGDLPVARLGFGTMRLPTGTFTGPVRDRRTGSRCCAGPSSWA